jgi:PAS domain S-box-containing protein
MSTGTPPNAVQRRSDALERVSDGVVALDQDLRYTYVNTRATELLDTDADSLLGEHVWEAFPSTRGTKAQDAIERAIETDQRTSFERYNDQLAKWWKVRVHPDQTGVTIVFSDITEQKERLYELERKDTLFQNAQDGLFVIDVEDGGGTFRVNQVNPAYEHITGISAEELQGRTIREITDEEDSAAVRERYADCVRGRTPRTYEEHLAGFDSGSWWETSIAPVIVDDEVTQIVGSTRNVTEQKEREQRLQKFEQMIEHTGHAVLFTGVDGEIEYANPEFEELTGYTAAEVRGKTPHVLSSGAHDDAFFADLWETVLDGKVWSGEIENERKDGTQFVATHTIAPVMDESGSVTHFVAIYEDITDRKEREEELRRKTRALDTAPIGITITEPSQEDNPMTYVNEKFTEITGYEREAAVGRNCRLLQGPETDAEQVAKLRDAIDEARETELTLRNYRADGTAFWNRLSIAPVRAEDGTLESFVGFQKDVTEEKEQARRLETHELLVQTMDEEAVLVDSDKRIRFANEAATDFADVPVQAAEGLPVRSVVEAVAAPDEDPQRFLDVIDAVLYSVEPDSGERLADPDGTETVSLEFDLYIESIGKIHTEQRLVPVELEDGERGVAVISRDITQRREREQEIQTHLVQAQEIGNMGSWGLEIGKSELQWSDKCYRIFGLEPGTPMTYERFLELVHPEDRAAVDDAWNEALIDGSYDIEHRIIVDGETRWVQETGEIEFSVDGEPEVGIGVVRDITNRVRQTREIRAQKRRYESLFNSVSGAVVVTDPDGCITTYNPGFVDLFGYESEDIEGCHLSTITDEQAAVERLLEETDVPSESRLVNYRKNSGQVFTGESRSSSLRTHNDTISGYVVHIVDVSEAQENREQLQVLSRILRHNVKNDMNVIQGRAELIEARGSPAVRADVEKILEKSRNFVEMAEHQHRITELLTETAETVTVDVASTTRRVVSDLQTQYSEAVLQTDLTTECQAKTPSEIGEAVRELVQNAIVHSDQEQPIVDIQLQCTETMAEIKIRDDGPGIPKQEWDVLTVDGEISALNHGTGLGLWFVNQVVRRSNGGLSFAVNDSGGTTVTVRLPTS